MVILVIVTITNIARLYLTDGVLGQHGQQNCSLLSALLLFDKDTGWKRINWDHFKRGQGQLPIRNGIPTHFVLKKGLLKGLY